MAKTPILTNQHPVRTYANPNRQSGGGIAPTQVIQKRKKGFSLCDLLNIFSPQVAQTNPNAQVQTTTPSVIKLFTTNPVSVGTVSMTLMLENPNRIGMRITNVGLTTIYIGIGTIPTPTSYDHILPGCQKTVNDGTGGVLVDDGVYLDQINVLSSAVGGLVAIVERP